MSEFNAFVDLLLEARTELGVPGAYSDPNLTEFVRHNIDTVCNPGDKCYEIVGSKIKKYTIDYFTAYKDKNIQEVQACLVNNDGLFDLRSVDDFGRTLYLTKKEADFRLNGWDRDNNFDEQRDASGNSFKIQNRLFRRIAAVICSNKMRGKKISERETIKQLANAIRVLAETIYYTKLSDELSYEEHSALHNIIHDMLCLVTEVNENE